MKIGKAVIGGIVGGVFGVVLQVGLDAFAGYEVGWMAPVIGALTGIGVRSSASPRTNSTGSFSLGAVAGIIALGCIVGAHFAASGVTQWRLAEADTVITPAPHGGAAEQKALEANSVSAKDDGAADHETQAAILPEEATANEEEAIANDNAEEAEPEPSEPSSRPSSAGEEEESASQKAQEADEDRVASPPARLIVPEANPVSGKTKVQGKSVLSSAEFIWFTVGTAIAYLLGGTTPVSPKAGEEERPS